MMNNKKGILIVCIFILIGVMFLVIKAYDLHFDLNIGNHLQTILDVIENKNDVQNVEKLSNLVSVTFLFIGMAIFLYSLIIEDDT